MHFFLRKITVTKLGIFLKITSSCLWDIKFIPSKNQINNKPKKRKKKTLLSKLPRQIPSGGHWRFESKRWGQHKYKLITGICIAELLGPAGAAQPHNKLSNKLSTWGLDCQVRIREGLLQGRSVSPSEWQLETSASLVAYIRRSHGILGQAANQRSPYPALCLQAKLYYMQHNEDE